MVDAPDPLKPPAYDLIRAVAAFPAKRGHSRPEQDRIDDLMSTCCDGRAVARPLYGVHHQIFYFGGWQGRDVRDLNSPDEQVDGPIWGYGSGWSTATILSGANKPVPWMVYRIINNVCTERKQEFAIAFGLNTPPGQVAGYSVSHLSNYHIAEGQPFNNGQQIANLSGLGDESYFTYQNDTCTTVNTEGGKHLHVEWAHQSPITFSAIDPVTGPSYYPYWYYNYP